MIDFLRKYWVLILAGSLPIIPSSALADQGNGTLFVVPKFDIRQQSRTEIRVVNNADGDLKFHYNYVCPGIPGSSPFCPKLDRTVQLTSHQTKLIDVAGDHPPCNQGFLIGYPVNDQNKPISNNVLTGSYTIFNGSLQAGENAVVIRSVKPTGNILGDSNGFSFTSGPNQDFEAIKPLLLSDFKASNDSSENSHTRLIVLDLGAALGMQNPVSIVSVDFWNSAELPFSSSFGFVCWTDVVLEDIDQNFLDENLGTQYGALKLNSELSCPLPGGCPPLKSRAPLLLGAIQENNEADIRDIPAVGCNDNDPNTDDSFDPTSGCKYTPKCSGANCDDNNNCTVDSCDIASGHCVHNLISCDDNNPCTIDSCDVQTGCKHVGINCNDSNACTRDSCDVATGACTYTPIQCTDSDACTVDSCSPTLGCQFTPVICDDGDDCTNDSCNQTSGCVFTLDPQCILGSG